MQYDVAICDSFGRVTHLLGINHSGESAERLMGGFYMSAADRAAGKHLQIIPHGSLKVGQIKPQAAA